MAAARLIALQIHNILAENPLKPAQYLYLPAVDGALQQSKAPTADWVARMQKRYGDRLEKAPTDG